MHENRTQIYLFINFLYHTLNAKCATRNCLHFFENVSALKSLKPSAMCRKTLLSNLQSLSISSPMLVFLPTF